MKDVKPNMKRIYEDGCPHSSDIIVDNHTHLKRMNTALTMIVISILIMLGVLAVSFAYVATRPSTALSYSMDSEGRVIQIEPVSQPYSQARVIGFATETVKDSLHISFTDYQDHFLALSSKFTTEGFSSYQKELVDKGWVEKITNDNLVMWVEIKQAPKFLNSGTGNGRYFYELTFDIDLYLGGGDRAYKPTRLNVRVLIVRTEDNLDGLKIQRLLIGEVQ